MPREKGQNPTKRHIWQKGYSHELVGWADDDFFNDDLDSKIPMELDPWDIPEEDGSASSNPSEELSRESPDSEDAITESWDYEDFQDYEFDEQWYGYLTGADISNEPAPIAEADNKLSETKYPKDESITNLSWELKIGEFLACLEPCTPEQHARCLELFRAYSVSRLCHLLPWMRQYVWDGQKLQFFLEFRNYWEASRNIEWWEIIFWDFRSQSWIPTYDKSTLTYDQTWELLKKRAKKSVSQVIDRKWILEWEKFAMWEYGIRSFAQYALLRSDISRIDHIWEYLKRDDRRTPLEIAQCRDPVYAPFMLPSERRQYACPNIVASYNDPWPEVTDRARRMAETFGGDLTRAWESILSDVIEY
ncbi:MAG: hypothetical protein OXD44_03900 [Gammaproteobacteria bacterium]|nr:hypothetical protein [Gammaproteobacteria bacterium]